MKANFGAVHPKDITQEWLNERAEYLANTDCILPATFRYEPGRPMGLESYQCVDVIGAEFKWMNENFPKEQYKWYLWFESIFLVPPEMATFLKLRWAK
jgi:hypothetical protein